MKVVGEFIAHNKNWLGGLTRYFNDVIQGVVALYQMQKNEIFLRFGYPWQNREADEDKHRISHFYPQLVYFSRKIAFPLLVGDQNWKKRNRKNCESFQFFPVKSSLDNYSFTNKSEKIVVEFSLPPHFSSYLEWWAFCCPFSSPQTWQFFNFLYTLENERSSILENPLILSHQEKQIFALLRPLKTLRWMVN